MATPLAGDRDDPSAYVCSVCGELHGSSEQLAIHRRDGHAAGDRGPTGTTGSGHSGTAPPTGTGGVATP